MIMEPEVDGNAKQRRVNSEPASVNEETAARGAWCRYNLLSFDGGGVRGYWSLLVLERLMEYIATEEAATEDAHLHSFAPEHYPDVVSQVPLTGDAKATYNAQYDYDLKLGAIPRSQRYLPCHYFDYIGGTSTGGLIAIMLGRFRMTVKDCLQEYETLAGRIFANPRFFAQKKFILGNQPLYKASDLEKVVSEVIERRKEQSKEHRVEMPSGQGLCRTFVTTVRTESNQPSVEKPYLIRSYNHPAPPSPNASRKSTGKSGAKSRIHSGPSRQSTNLSSYMSHQQATRRDTGLTQQSNGANSRSGLRSGGNNNRKPRRDINYGPARQFTILEAARAATAAEFFFEKLSMDIDKSSGPTYFTDGGYGFQNNPTKVGIEEIEEKYGINSVGTIISIGTARENIPKKSGFFSLPSKIEHAFSKATDPEVVHRELEAKTHLYLYHRLNNPGTLEVALDEWKPRVGLFNKLRRSFKPGSETMTIIHNNFNQWAANPSNVQMLQGCAQILVQQRIERTHDRAKWERYATCAQYSCPYPESDCQTFLQRSDYLTHLEVTHGVGSEDQEAFAKKYRTHWQYQPAKDSISLRRPET